MYFKFPYAWVIFLCFQQYLKIASVVFFKKMFQIGGKNFTALWAARGRGERALAHGEEIAVAAGWVALPRMLLGEVNEDVRSSAVHSNENWKLLRHQQRKSLNRGLLNLQVVCCLFSNAGSFLSCKVIFFAFIYLFVCLFYGRRRVETCGSQFSPLTVVGSGD